jgi:hypothetical protein
VQVQARDPLHRIAPRDVAGLTDALKRTVAKKLHPNSEVDWSQVKSHVFRDVLRKHEFSEIDPKADACNGASLIGSFKTDPNTVYVRMALEDFGTEKAFVDITPADALSIAAGLIEFAAVCANLNNDAAFFSGPLLSTINALSSPEKVDELMRRILVALDQQVEVRASVKR